MKKFLAISSAFLMMTSMLTGCGAEKKKDKNEDSYYEHYDYGRDDHRNIEEHAHDAIDGAKNAGEDIVGGAGDAANSLIDGAGNAAKDVIDGLDGSTEHLTNTTTKVTTKR